MLKYWFPWKKAQSHYIDEIINPQFFYPFYPYPYIGKKVFEFARISCTDPGGAGGSPAPNGYATEPSRGREVPENCIENYSLSNRISYDDGRSCNNLGHRSPVCISIIWNVERYVLKSESHFYSYIIGIKFNKNNTDQGWIVNMLLWGWIADETPTEGAKRPIIEGETWTEGTARDWVGEGVMEGHRRASSQQRSFENV